MAHLARGIAVVSNLARFRSVAEGERLLPRAITDELENRGHDERDGGVLVTFEQLGDASGLPQDGCAFFEVIRVCEGQSVLAPRLAGPPDGGPPIHFENGALVLHNLLSHLVARAPPCAHVLIALGLRQPKMALAVVEATLGDE